MKPGRYNLTIVQGATYRKRLRVKEKSTGDYYDFTGYSARAHLRPETGSDDLFVQLTTANGGLTLDDEGHIDLYIHHEVTATIDSEGAWDLELVEPSGDIVRLLKGTIRLDPEVTR